MVRTHPVLVTGKLVLQKKVLTQNDDVVDFFFLLTKVLKWEKLSQNIPVHNEAQSKIFEGRYIETTSRLKIYRTCPAEVGRFFDDFFRRLIVPLPASAALFREQVTYESTTYPFYAIVVHRSSRIKGFLEFHRTEFGQS